MNAIKSIIIFFFTISGLSGNSIKPRIIGGDEAAEGEFEYQAALILNGLYYCGAAIITDKHLLTSAHCLEPFFVSVFEIDPKPIVATILIGSIMKLRGIPHAVKRVSRHRGYSPNSEYISPDDIGVIHVLKSMMMSPYVRPISLPDQDSDILLNTSVIVSGFGSSSLGELPSNQLLKLNLKTALVNECQKLISKGLLNSQTQICTIPEPGFGCCHGDSGSPLVDINKETILGIACAGTENAGHGGPDIYTKVSKYVSYILDEVNYISHIIGHSYHPARNLI